MVDAAMRRIGRWTDRGAGTSGFIQWLVIRVPLDRPERLPEKGRSGRNRAVMNTGALEIGRCASASARLYQAAAGPTQPSGEASSPPEPVAIRPPEFLTDEVRVERLAHEPVDRTAQDSQAPPAQPDQARSLRASLVKLSPSTPLDAANRSTGDKDGPECWYVRLRRCGCAASPPAARAWLIQGLWARAGERARLAMRVDLFDFDLPPELIAQHPVRPRDAARLLVVARRRSRIAVCAICLRCFGATCWCSTTPA